MSDFSPTILHSSPTGVRLRVCRSPEEVEAIRSAWECMQWHPNADIDFYLLINESRPYVTRPHVILLELYGEPLAMLVGRIERVPLTCRVGYLPLMRPRVNALTVVYGGVMGNMTPSLAPLLIDEVYAALQRGEADLARISGLVPDSVLYRYARRRPALPCRDHLSATAPHWRITLPDSFEEFLQRFKSKRRSELRRMERLLEKSFPGRVDHRIFHGEADVEPLCRDVEAVACQTYQRGMGAGFINDPEHQRRFRLEAARGRLRAYLVYLDGRPCAFEIGTLYKDTFHLEYTGYDPALRKFEIGTLVFMKMLADLCQHGIRQVDCGQGDAHYKQQYGDQCQQETNVLLFAPTLRAAWINAIHILTVALERLAGGASRRLQLEHRIKKSWRKLLVRGAESPPQQPEQL